MAQKVLLFFGAVLLVTKEQLALYIRECSSGVATVTEDTDVSFTCGLYTYETGWSYSHDGQSLNSIGYCNNFCYSQNASMFTLQTKTISRQTYESTVYIRNITRQQDFHLHCSEGEIAATCRVRVVGSPIVKNCDVSIVNWQVRGTCVVENMYSSDGNHACTWRVNNTERWGYFQGSLTQYWFEGRAYERGVCYFNRVMPTYKGNYTYSINIDTGFWNTVKTLNIVYPGDPKYTCPDVVYEGSRVTCACTSSNPGSPLAEFVWSGQTTDTLYVENVKREDNGTRHTCIMTWGPESLIKRQVVFILKVAVPVRIVPSSCSVQLSRWKVQGVCTIQWLEMNNTPECRWRSTYQSRGYGSYVRTKSVDLGEFQDPSTVFTVDSVRYKRRNCTFQQTMPDLENDYSYSIRVSSHPHDQFSKYLRIERPGKATHNCPAIFYEGSSINCMCNSSKAGNPPAEFIWKEVNSDRLHLDNVQRENSGINYTCQLTWGPNRSISHDIVYSLNIIPLVSIVPGSCSVELSRWKVYGVCTIKWLRINKNRTCSWRLKKKNTEALLKVQRVFSSKSEDIFEYENCSFLYQMPVDDCKYTYSISVSSHPNDTFSKFLQIEKPDKPQHNCSNVTLEGSSINCTCFSPNLGNPPAQIGWMETNKEHFAIKSVNRTENGFVATCRLTWGTINYTTPYVVTIAYGPSETYISREESSEDKSKTVLICTAVDVHPSAVFRWNISCDKETHSENISRCTVSTPPVEDIMAVQCMAHNQIFTDVSSNSTYVLKPEEKSLLGGIIVGSAAAVVILTIIVAVIFVYIKRRKDDNKNKIMIPTVHFAASSRDLYTIVGNVDHRHHGFLTARDRTNLDNISGTQSSQSENMYAIAGPVGAGGYTQDTKQKTTKNIAYATQSIIAHHDKNTTHQKIKEKESIKPKPTALGKKKLQNMSVNKPETQTPVVHFTSASEGLYSIAGPVTGDKQNQLTVQDAIKNRLFVAGSKTDNKNRSDLSVQGYMNVTEVPTYSIPNTVGSDARVLDQSVITEDEYNVLSFQEDRTGQEDHAVTYSHLYFN